MNDRSRAGRMAALALAAVAVLAAAPEVRAQKGTDVARTGGVPISAEVTGHRDLAVSVYNDNIGVIRDRRRFSIRSGESELRLDDVASTIDATSVRLRPLGKRDIDVLSQDFRFDLANADRLLERYLNRQIEVTSTDDQVRRGTLLSYDPTSIVLRQEAGTVLLMTRSEIRHVALREPAEGLVTRPTLLWRVRSGGSGEEPIEVSYIANALSWRADYVATLEPGMRSLDLQGWASIENRSGVSYPNAKLDLVAGSLHRAAQPPMPYQAARDMAGVAASKMEQFQERAFSEYHVYELPQRVTIANNEVKQLGLLEAKSVKSTPRYVYDAQRDAQRVMSTVQFTNAGSGLARPIPQGVVRIYQKDRDGSLRLVGEDQVQHTAARDTVRLSIGTAFDITAERRQTDQQQVTPRTLETAVEIKLTNHKSESVDVAVVEHAWGDWTVTDSSHKWRKVDATTFEFVVRCPPEKPVTITYRLQIQTGARGG